MIDAIHNELALLPLSKLNAALALRGLNQTTSKNDAVRMLAAEVVAGNISPSEIKSLPRAPLTLPIGGQQQQAPDNLPALKSAINSAIGQVEKTAENAVETSERAVAAVDQVVRQIHSQLTSALVDINFKIDSSKVSLENQINSIERNDLGATVAAEVAKVFAPFKQSVTEERLIEVAAQVPSIRLERADSLFPECAYESGGTMINFGSRLVGVWDDPQSPEILSDYVFSPEHLHQTLIALDDDLPDNLWLAGERGTGKTEFVTQIAARLGRRLFRVNFDEAIERADFIGSNTIKDGNVVWQAGIITQAIQHAGAIVLLDEVGFARAQSIAILHSVCERSPNRSITVPETGAKIKVAPYVSFFAADNSNGHGDTSGNFAGVRDQNSAFLDRFGFTLQFDYLSVHAEADLIAKRTNLSSDKALHLVKFASIAREKCKAGLLTQPPSLRQLFAWARAIKGGMPVGKAFTNAIINKFPEDVHSELLGVYSATIDESIL